jgi:hypothetical protein
MKSRALLGGNGRKEGRTEGRKKERYRTVIVPTVHIRVEG